MSARALISATNGVFGDFLARSGNGLAAPTTVRRANGEAVALQPDALAAAFPRARPDLAIWLHGLCCDDGIWASGPPRPRADDFPERLEQDAGWTAVRIRYNSGRAIADNGAELAGLLEAVVRHWPTRVRRIALIGHSMGGLIARSAGHHAVRDGQRWAGLATHLVCLGSPHTGAPLERFGHGVSRALAAFDITRPLATAIDARARGIRDLHDGQPLADGDTLLAPLPNARLYQVGALLGHRPDDRCARWLGDGLVPVDSALATPPGVAPADAVLLPGLHHFALVHDRRVLTLLRRWLPPR